METATQNIFILFQLLGLFLIIEKPAEKVCLFNLAKVNTIIYKSHDYNLCKAVFQSYEQKMNFNNG